MEEFLSPRDLAAAIGVSESSLKRWVDGGLLEASRTVGGHRRIALTEAVRFIRKNGTPVLRPELLGLAGLQLERRGDRGTDLAEALHEALVADDRILARSLILSAFFAGEPLAALCDGPIRSALNRIGELWQHNDAGIMVEHRAVDIIVQTLNMARGLLAPVPVAAPAAVGGTPSGDPYLLPSLMVAAVLADAGYRDVNLGPDVPARTLRAAVVRYQPRIVWLAVSTPIAAETLRRECATVAGSLGAAGAALIVGGRGVDAAALAQLPRVHVLESMAEMGAFARGLRAA